MKKRSIGIKKKDQNCIGKPILIKLCSTLIILEI